MVRVTSCTTNVIIINITDVTLSHTHTHTVDMSSAQLVGSGGWSGDGVGGWESNAVT